MTRRPESSLIAPAMDWLRSRGVGSILGEFCTGDLCLADLVTWLPDNSTVAVELKVSDWRRALSQAARNLWFFRYSWVGMAEEYAAPATRNAKVFEEAGVSLLAVGTGSAKVIVEAPRTEPTLGAWMDPLYWVVAVITAPLDGHYDLSNVEAKDYIASLETGAAFTRRYPPRDSYLKALGLIPANKVAPGKTRVKPRRPQKPHDPEVARQILADLGLTGESGGPC